MKKKVKVVNTGNLLWFCSKVDDGLVSRSMQELLDKGVSEENIFGIGAPSEHTAKAKAYLIKEKITSRP